MYQSESMDPDGRGHRNLIRMMMEDGFFKYLPKGDDNWVNFLKPFLDHMKTFVPNILS